MARMILEVDEDAAGRMGIDEVRRLAQTVHNGDLRERLKDGPIRIAQGIEIVGLRDSISGGVTLRVGRDPDDRYINQKAENARAAMGAGGDEHE